MQLEYVKKHIATKLNEITSTAGKRILKNKEEILTNISASTIGPNSVSEDIQLLLDVYIASEILYIDCGRKKAKPFGYKEFAIFIKSICETYNIKEQDDFYARIYSVLRNDVTYEQYIAQNLFEEDINNLYGILSGEEESDSSEIGTSNTRLRRAIATEYHEIIKKSLSIIKSRYAYLTSSIFGIKTYAGVVLSNECCMGIKNGKAIKLKPEKDLKKYYLGWIAGSLIDQEVVLVKEDRQFNYTDMAKAASQNKAPFYYPYKILELVSKCGTLKDNDYTFTKQTKDLNYTRIPANILGNHTNYLKHIVSYFEKSIIDYIFTSLYLECSGRYDKFNALDAEGKEIYLIKEVEDNSAAYLGTVVASLQFFTNSVTTAIIVSDLTTMTVNTSEGTATKINAIKFMLSVPNKNLNNVDFVTSVANAMGLTIDNMKNLETNLYNEEDESYQLLDLKYTVDVKLAQGLPDFAYKALAELTKQGVALNWQNILLGNSIKDDLITSIPSGDICLQDNRVHWIFAGSRSGKGVMCYNIFTTAMASGLPIFYMDRKPDTSAAMREIAPNMFAVNGADYKPEIDYKGTFAYSAKRITFKNIPSYLSHLSDDELRDYAYMRGILLTFALLGLGDKYKDTEFGKELAKSISNPIIVIDEFSNFFHDFLGPKFHQQGWFSSALSDRKISDKFKNYAMTIEKAKGKMNKKSDNKSKTDDEADKIALNNALQDKPDLAGLYMSAVAKGYSKVLSTFKNAINAGGSLVPNMHVFVIGQNLDEVLEGSNTFANDFISGDNKLYKVSPGICPLVSCLDNFDSDFILGANIKKAAITADPLFEKNRGYVNLEKRFFAYKKGVKLKTELTNIVSNGDASGYTPFKPFLILNNAEQPPESVTSINLAPTRADREKIRKGILDDSLRPSQFVGQCLCNVEDAGLEWKDLLGANPSEHDPSILHDGVGLPGYVERMAQANSVPLSDIVDKLNKSGELMNKFVKEVYGYTGTWEEFIYDMDPKWIITTEGAVEDSVFIPVEKRLSTSFLLPGIVASHPEKYLQDELSTLLYLYTGDGAPEPIDIEDINFEDEFRRNIESDEPNAQSSQSYSQGYSSQLFTDSDFNFDDEDEIDEDDDFIEPNASQPLYNGLTLSQIREIINLYAEKANLSPSQWGDFTAAVVKQLGL